MSSYCGSETKLRRPTHLELPNAYQCIGLDGHSSWHCVSQIAVWLCLIVCRRDDEHFSWCCMVGCGLALLQWPFLLTLCCRHVWQWYHWMMWLLVHSSKFLPRNRTSSQAYLLDFSIRKKQRCCIKISDLCTKWSPYKVLFYSAVVLIRGWRNTSYSRGRAMWLAWWTSGFNSCWG